MGVLSQIITSGKGASGATRLEQVFLRINKSIHAHYTNRKTKSHEMFLYLFRVMRVDHALGFLVAAPLRCVNLWRKKV